MMSTHVTNTNLTETEFYHAELRVWGEEYVESLLERGYTPVLTSSGWRWLVTNSNITELVPKVALSHSSV